MQHHNQHHSEQGFTTIILAIIVVIGVIVYFGIDVRAIVDSDQFQAALSQFVELSGIIWKEVLRDPVILLFENIIEYVFGGGAEATITDTGVELNTATSTATTTQ